MILIRIAKRGNNVCHGHVTWPIFRDAETQENGIRSEMTVQEAQLSERGCATFRASLSLNVIRIHTAE